jgi:hypothetical protein
MLAFGHVSVLVSIVVGLSISQVLFGLGQLLRRRGTYEIDALYLLTNAIVLFLLVDCWWTVFSWRNELTWSYKMTWLVLLNPIVVAMAAQLIPPDWEQQPLDLHRTYYKNHRLIFALLAIYPLLDMIDTRAKGADHFNSLGLGYPITSMGMCVLCVSAVFVKTRSVRIVCSAGILLVILSWVFEIYSYVPMG